MDKRLEELTRWLRKDQGLPAFDIVPASSDASFRRYFRLSFGGETRIAMDAPPGKEGLGPFMAVAGMLLDMGLNVPQVLAADEGGGFLLLTDLGEASYLSALDEANVERLYGDALGALAVLQACGPRGGELPPYDRALFGGEMGLFRDWFLGRHLGLELGGSERAALEGTFGALADAALEQPVACVHRDYHSRNLMVCAHNPGILDFQDAVVGPVTYDLVSLLRDCYIAWPRERVEDWVLGYQDLALHMGILRERDGERFLRWFDLMGVQRHLKAIGIFSRLKYRDGKADYINDIPRTLGYVREVAGRYRELAAFHALLDERLMPAIPGAMEDSG